MTKPKHVKTAAPLGAENNTQHQPALTYRARAQKMVAEQIQRHLYASDKLIELIEERDALDYRIECEVEKCLKFVLASL